MTKEKLKALVRGGGDLATGVAIRLFRTGFDVLVTEIEAPLAVRRNVSLAEAIFGGWIKIEEVVGVRVEDENSIYQAFHDGQVPVRVDPDASSHSFLKPDVFVDGRMLKTLPDRFKEYARLTIGLGPGFEAGVHCHAVIETNRGHRLGCVYWQGSAAEDTGVPEQIWGRVEERVLRAPTEGNVFGRVPIGEIVDQGDLIAEVGGEQILASFSGVVRGLIHESVPVRKGEKIGDLDPRADPLLCWQISDKALAIGGGVLEAVFSVPDLRLKRFS